MVEEMITIYKNQIKTLEKKIEFIEKILENQEFLKKELEEQKKIINSEYEILNIIMSNKFIKANGLLRNLQLHTLEIFKFTENICKKYGITYWLDFGTLVGGIRHEGFIPWDDEIDLAMPRQDFEKFIKILPYEVKRFEGLGNKLILKVNTIPKNAKIGTYFPSPVLAILNKTPFASMEIHPIEYIELNDENPDLNYYSEQFVKIRNEFKETYINENPSFNEWFIECSKKMHVVPEKTNFMACSVDGSNRKIIETKHVFPLKKCKFEDCVVNIPNNPKNYLSTVYRGDHMNIPKTIRHHNFTGVVKTKESGKDLDKLYQEELSFWRNINDNF